MGTDEAHLVWDDLVAWLKAHGHHGQKIKRVEFRAPAVDEHLRVFITVTSFATTSDGRRLQDRLTGKPIEDVITVPLKHLPEADLPTPVILATVGSRQEQEIRTLRRALWRAWRLGIVAGLVWGAFVAWAVTSLV